VLDVLLPILIALAIICGALGGRLDAVGTATAEGARAAVDLAIGLLASLTLWLGLVRVLQAGGFLALVTRAAAPLLRRLFPEVPADHPAMGYITLNIASNVMDLGNAATPLGLKAMRELDRLNGRPGVATDAMVLFVAINTASVTLFPHQIMALRAALGAKYAGSILLPTLLATIVSTGVAILAAKLLAPRFRAPEGGEEGEEVSAPPEPSPVEAPVIEAAPSPPSALRRGLALVLAGAIAATVGIAFWLRLEEDPAGWTGVAKAAAGGWILPLLVGAIVLWGLGRGVAVYEQAVEGGREAFDVVLRILPYLVMVLVATAMLRASGAFDLLLQAVGPLAAALGMPPEAIPMGMMRSLSGSGARGLAAELMKVHGPDSFVGNVVSVIQGSTETTFYVLAVYFGAARIRIARHALLVCLFADAVGVIASVWACRLLL
jgi:spore maturation protein SpmA